MGIIAITIGFFFFLAFCSTTTLILYKSENRKIKIDFDNYKKRTISKDWIEEQRKINVEVFLERQIEKIRSELAFQTKSVKDAVVHDKIEEANNVYQKLINEAKIISENIITMATEKSERECNLLKEEVEEKVENIEKIAKEKAETLVKEAEEKAANIYDRLVKEAKTEAKSILSSAKSKIDHLEEEKELLEKARAVNERDYKTYQNWISAAKANNTRANNIRKEAIKFKQEAEEILQDMYKQSDEYMEGLRSRTQIIIEQTHIENDYDFESLSKELKEELNKHKFQMKHHRWKYATIDFKNRRHEESKICELALCYCDVLIDSLVGKIGKIGLEKAYEKMYEAILSVEELIPKNFNFIIRRDYIQIKKEMLALAFEIENYKVQKREERKLKLQAEREERQAQKEIEAERKRAEKDMIAAEAAIEKNRIAMALAKSEEEKLKYKEQVIALEESLRKSQERHERAISMAQQTRCGYVYVISNIGSFGEGVYKIGMTRRVNPMERVVELGDASVPFPFDVHAMIYTEDAPGLESALHRAFESRKINAVNYRKEYFYVPLDEIKEEVAKHGVLYDEWINEPIAAQWRDSVSK